MNTQLINVKKIHYYNSVEVRFYEKALIKGKTKEETDKSYLLSDKEPTESERRNKEEHSKHTSLNRSKNTVIDIARANEWEYFITLTFDKNKIDRYNYEECRKTLTFYLNNLKKRKFPDMYYLFLPEQHKDGAWHFHGLIGCTSGHIDMESIGLQDSKVKDVYNLTSWKKGFSTATKVKDTRRVSTYITKYITKSLLEISGKSRYIASKDVKRGIVEELFLNKDKYHYEKMKMFKKSVYAKVVQVPNCDNTITYCNIDHDTVYKGQ